MSPCGTEFSWADWESCSSRHKSCWGVSWVGLAWQWRTQWAIHRQTPQRWIHHPLYPYTPYGSVYLHAVHCHESSGSLLLPSLLRDITANLGCCNFGLTQSRLKLLVSLLNKELLQASGKDGSWAVAFLPSVGRVSHSSSACLHPHQGCGRAPPKWLMWPWKTWGSYKAKLGKKTPQQIPCKSVRKVGWSGRGL